MNWYCIHTKPHKEMRVAAYCHHPLGVETYFPQLREYKTVRQVRRLVNGPLFPRYLFCRFDPAESYRAVRYAPDALDIVNIAGRPAIVADSLIDEIKHWSGEAFEGRNVRPSLASGDSVAITNGPLRGLSAVIIHARDDQDRVAILLSLLHESARITISRDWLERVSSDLRVDDGLKSATPCSVVNIN